MDPVERGRQAKRLLGDDVFQAAENEARSDIMEMWEHGETVEDREAAHGRLSGLGAIRTVLERYAAEVDVFEATQPVDEEITD